jgi:hypothetical protein
MLTVVLQTCIRCYQGLTPLHMQPPHPLTPAHYNHKLTVLRVV